MTRPATRLVLTLAASGAIALTAAAPAVAGTAPTSCATDIDASWSAEYAGGRYQLDSLTLDGLAGCVGSTIDVVISAAGYPLAEIRTTVTDSVVVLDLAHEHIAAARVDELALAVSAVAPAGTVGSAVTERPRPGAAGIDDGAVSVGAATAERSLPTTGVEPTWLLGLAAALAVGGAMLRRRGEGRSDA